MKHIEKHNEATIQYELYFQLRNAVFHVVPEYQVQDLANKTKKGNTRRAKFDLVVVVNEHIICAIETKKENILGDVPLLYCRRMDSIPSLIEKIKLIKHGNS